MSLLVDATPLASGHRWRGIGTYVRHLVRGLAARPSESPRFLTLGDGSPDVAASLAVPLCASVPVRWHDLWPFYARSLPGLIRDRGFALYHSTSPEATLHAGAVRTVATVYDLIPAEEQRHDSADPRGWWRDRLYQRYLQNLRGAGHLIAISRATATAITERLAIPDERITVIPLGIDAFSFRERAERTRAEMRGSLHLPTVYWLSVTSPNPNKGWRDLIRALGVAYRAGSRVPLVIAGYWLPKQRERLMSLARQLGVSESVTLVGHVSEELLPALYAEALGFVFASHREGFGYPVLEAMAVGAPIVATDDPAVIELTQTAARRYPRGDFAALSEQMLQLEDDQQLRERLHAQGLERSSCYAWDQTIERTMGVYQSMLQHE